MKKNQGSEIKDSGEAYHFNLFTNVFTLIQSGMNTLQDFCFILKHKIQLFAGRLRRKLKEGIHVTLK